MANVIEKRTQKMTKIKVFPISAELFDTLAFDFTRRAVKAVKAKGFFDVVLSGGSTPVAFFTTLTNLSFCLEKTPWEKIRFFFSDERYVPHEDSESNYRLAHEHLFSKVAINPDYIYPMPTNYLDPVDASKAYDADLHQCFQLKKHQFPPFDVVYLGLGSDAHTASLFPFSDVVLSPPDRLATSLWVEKASQHRLTLTPKTINQSRAIIFMVTGEDKASAVQAVLKGPKQAHKFPAQLIHCEQGKTYWYLDQAAAELLK